MQTNDHGATIEQHLDLFLRHFTQLPYEVTHDGPESSTDRPRERLEVQKVRTPASRIPISSIHRSALPLHSLEPLHADRQGVLHRTPAANQGRQAAHQCTRRSSSPSAAVQNPSSPSSRATSSKAPMPVEAQTPFTRKTSRKNVCVPYCIRPNFGARGMLGFAPVQDPQHLDISCKYSQGRRIFDSLTASKCVLGTSQQTHHSPPAYQWARILQGSPLPSFAPFHHFGTFRRKLHSAPRWPDGLQGIAMSCQYASSVMPRPPCF